jgi:hypothetical protein
VKYGFILEQQKTYPITVLCKVMLVSTSAYYAWVNQPGITDQMKDKQALEQRVTQIFEDSRRTYGSRRLSDELKKSDTPVGRYKARTLMTKLGLQVRYPKRFKVTTDSNHDEAISPNLLDRKFDVAAPNQVWTTDITYVWTLEGWMYVAIVVDLFSRQIVGWAMDDHCTHRCVWQPCKWLIGAENRNRDCCTTQIVVANMPALNTVSI